MELIRPPLLRAGDTVRAVSPSCSRAMVAEHDHSALIEQRLAALGLRVDFGAHVDERDSFDSSSIASRVADLHDAFTDPAVSGILAVIGGFASNELLPYLDFDLIRAHPKVFCGYSDITALNNAILARSGLVTSSGPLWSTFGMRDHLAQTLDWFTRTLLDGAAPDGGFDVEPTGEWTDDLWFLDQDDRHPMPNDGWWPLRPGAASGRIIGGNLCTLNLLQGTPWMPSLDGALLFVEDDAESLPRDLARDLTSLLQLPDAAGIRGLVIGRFQGTAPCSARTSSRSWRTSRFSPDCRSSPTPTSGTRVRSSPSRSAVARSSRSALPVHRVACTSPERGNFLRSVT